MAKKLAKKLAKKQDGGSEGKYDYKKSVYPDGPTFKPTSPTSLQLTSQFGDFWFAGLNPTTVNRNETT